MEKINIKQINNYQLNNRQALLGISYFTKIGPATMRRLEKYFSSATSAFWANSFYLEKAGLKPSLAIEFIAWRKKFDITAVEMELKKEKINFITWHDPEYPCLLKEISSPPFILYYKGSLNTLDDTHKLRLAIVGSRKHSAYAEKTINEFIPGLVAEKIEIISGLALGIDSLAHRVTLNNRGLTIAVLGTGLDSMSIYPTINRKLAQEIINRGGIIISEFSPKTQALKQNFPQRNRIISGLAQATLVIEAKEKSGSLITAAYALDQNREVLAIPGNIFAEFSKGTNNLIKAGAKSITDLSDILEVFKIETNKATNNRPLKTKDLIFKNELEKIIYEVMQQANARAERITVDEIIKITKLDTAVINSTLSMLELRGIAKSDGISYDIN